VFYIGDVSENWPGQNSKFIFCCALKIADQVNVLSCLQLLLDAILAVTGLDPRLNVDKIVIKKEEE